MKKFYSLLVAVLMTVMGSLGVVAATVPATVKMTYISGTDADVSKSYGAVTTAYAGYNKISNGKVELSNKTWGVNNIAYLQVDASATPGPIKKVTLSGKFQQISARGMNYAFGYNSSEWSESLTWDTADRSITLISGATVTCSKATEDKEATVDITAAFDADEDKIVTIIVYNTAAGAGYIKDATATVEYEKADEVLVDFPFSDETHPTMVPDGSNGDRGTCNYDYDSPINNAKFLNVWGENNSNGFKVATITSEDVTSYGQWTLEFDWAGYSGCNSMAGQTKLVDLEGNTFFSIDDAANWGNTFSLSTGQTVACYPCNKETRISPNTGSVLTGDAGVQYWHHFTVTGTVYGVSVTVEQYSKVEGEIQKTVVVKNVKASATNVTPAAIGLCPGSCGSVAIQNLKLTVGDLKIVSHNYRVRFLDQDNLEVKIDETRTAIDGDPLLPTEEDKETIVRTRVQYTYVSDDSEERVVDADNMILTIRYLKTSISDYTVNFVDASNNPIKDPATHKSVIVGTEVAATPGELSKILVDGVFYEYVSGNNPITLSDDVAQNVINLVFAPVEGVTGYFFNNYENRVVDWTRAKNNDGRYTPIVIDGSVIPNREVSGGEPVPFGNKSYFFGVNQAERHNNGTTLTSSDISVGEADFTFEARILLGSSNDQAGTTFTLFNKAGDAAILKLLQNGKSATSWTINDEAENLLELPNSGTYTGTDLNNLSNYSWYNFKVTVYNGISFLTVTDEAGTAIVDKKQITTLATSYGIGNMIFATSRYDANFAIDDVTVRSVVVSEDVPEGMDFVAVKINYVDEAGTPVKPADEAKFQVGQPVGLNSAFTADFKVDAEGNVWTAESESVPVTKYIYVSDNSADVTAALDAQVNIVFRGVAPGGIAFRYQIQKADGTITNKDDAGNNLPLFYASKKAGDIVFEKDILTYYYPYYLIVDGLLYKTGDNSGGTDKGTIEVGEGTSTKTTTPVTWVPAMETVPVIDPETGEPALDPETQQPITEEVQISNAVFAQETENIEGITVVKDQYTTIRQANGADGSAIGGNVLVTTLEPGIYTITSATRSGLTNFLINDEVVFSIESSGAVVTNTSKEFTVNAPSPLYIEEQSAITKYSDYVLIRKTGELKTYDITVELNATGQGTATAPSAAAAGAVITPVLTPAPGYELESYDIAVVDAEGTPVTVTDGSFIMPASDVTVTATGTFVLRKIYIETDLTADFENLTIAQNWICIDGQPAKYTATNYCPAVTTNSGKTVQVCEHYSDAVLGCTQTGYVLTQTVKDLTPGTYKIELYGGAAFTFGRGFGSMAFTGEIGTGDSDGTHTSSTYKAGDKIEPSPEISTGVSLIAETSEGEVGGEIPIFYATNFPQGTDIISFEGVEVGQNGEITIGMKKTSQSTNWHVVQLKGVTAQVLAYDLLANTVAKAKAVGESDVPAAIYSQIQEAIATYDRAYDTADEYKAAIKALDDLLDLVAGYSPLAKVLNEGEHYKANTPAESPAIATYDAAIAEVKAAYDAAVVADIPAAVAKVEAALPAIAKAQTAPNSDMTRAIVNPTINDSSTGWTCKKPKGGNGPLLNGNSFEYWAGSATPREEGSFDYYQIIRDLTPGKYIVSAEMFNSTNGEEGAVFAPTSGVYASSGNDETASLVDVDGTELIRYTTEPVFVRDGKLRLGVKNTELPIAARWFVADNFKLTLVEAIDVYDITVVRPEHGTVKVAPTKAVADETVVITATPASGYELASVMVTGVNTNIAVPVDVDELTGELSFTMPEDDVTVTATFQEAYVKLSDYAVAVEPEFVSDPEFGDEIIATITYSSDIKGSYAESFSLNAQFDYEVKDASGNVVASGTKNPLNVSDNTVIAYIDNLAANTTYTINITGVEVTDFDLATFESVVVFKEVVGLDGNPLATATFTTGLPTGIEAAPAAEEGVKADGKYFENGKIVIYKNGNKYDVSGAPMNK